MGLQQVLEGIEDKAKQEIEAIKKEAEKQKQQIIQAAKQEAQEQKERKIEEAKQHIDQQMRTELIRVRREGKKALLNLKAQFMDEVFQEAKQKFLDLDKKEYLSLLKDVLVAGVERGDEEIVMSPQDKKLVTKDFTEQVKKALQKKNKKAKLKFSFDLDKQDRGFILKSENVLINATVSSVFSSLKDKEEIEVARRLFG